MNMKRLSSLVCIVTGFVVMASTTPAKAANWVKFKECRTNQGEFWLDRATDGPWAQIVIRDDQLIAYLIDKGALDKGDLDYFNRQFAIGGYWPSGTHYINFHGDATYRAGKPGLDVDILPQGVRLSAGSHQIDWSRCFCQGTINGDSQCVGTMRCPKPVTLFNFTVTNCRTF